MLSRLFSVFFLSVFSFSVFFLFLPFYALAEPRLQIENQIYDFDVVSEGTAIEHDYLIRNIGDSVLEVQKIVPACGCTAAVVKSKKVKPGEETALKVRFDTNGFRGYKIKTVRVYTNDPKNSSIVLTLKGTVNPPIVVTPPQVNFGTIRKGTAQTKEVTVESSKSGVSIIAIRPRSEFIKVEKVELQGKTRLRVSLDESTPVGIFRSRVALRTNSKYAPLINLPVFAKIRGDLILSSAAVSFGLIEGPITEKVSQSVELVNQSEKPVLLLSATSDHPNVSVEVSPIEQGKKYKLNVSLSGSIVGALRAKIKIVTDHEDPQQKELILPVYGIVSRSSK